MAKTALLAALLTGHVVLSAAGSLIADDGQNPMFELDMYRLGSTASGDAADGGQASLTLADVGGIVHWLHTEDVVESLKDRTDPNYYAPHWLIESYRFKVKNPPAVLEETRHSLLSDFGPFSVYGAGAPAHIEHEPNETAGKSLSPGLDKMHARLGDFVGVRRQLDRRFPLPPDLPALRFSLPGFCPNLPLDKKGTPDAPNATCLKYDAALGEVGGDFVKGGRCQGSINPDGSPGCSFSYSAGEGDRTELWLDDVVGISDLECHQQDPGVLRACAEGSLGSSVCSNKCNYREIFEKSCLDSVYRRRFNTETGEIETDLPFCVEYDIHPDCIGGCDLAECKARLAKGEEIEVGLPFWLGRCDADANRLRVERVFAAFQNESLIFHGHKLFATKKLLVNDYVLKGSQAPCNRAENPKICKPHAAMGGPYCFRGFSGVCQPCFVPGAGTADGNITWPPVPHSHPVCPLAALRAEEYPGPASDIELLSCASDEFWNACCIYKGTCTGESDPSLAHFDDEGLTLVAARQSNHDLAIFFERYVQEHLKKTINARDNLRAWADKLWSATPQYLPFHLAQLDLQKSCNCISDVPKESGISTTAIVVAIIVVMLCVLALAFCFCYFMRDKTQTTGELAQSLQPTGNMRESSLQPTQANREVPRG